MAAEFATPGSLHPARRAALGEFAAQAVAWLAEPLGFVSPGRAA